MIQSCHWTWDSICADLLVMNAQPYRLYIERRDPERNMARFYALSIEATLFGKPGSFVAGAGLERTAA